jgi:hypothetical protein
MTEYVDFIVFYGLVIMLNCTIQDSFNINKAQKLIKV